MVKSQRYAAFLVVILLVSGCSLFDSSDTSDGRSVDPRREIFVVHSLAETISSVALNGDGSFGSVQPDLQYLGAVPNHILRLGEELLVTLSGQNELLRLDESTLQVTGRINHGAGNNPMETVSFYPGSGTTTLADGLVVTTHLFTDRVRIDDVRGRSWQSGPPWTSAAGQAPQALLALPGSSASQVRLLVANTAFSTSNPASAPYGDGTVTATTFQLTSSGSRGSLTEIPSEVVNLEDGGTGTNPTAIIDAPALNQVLVIGSGVNYGGGGNGADDGTLTILHRDDLSRQDRIVVGDSPGSAVLLPEGSGHRLYMAGPTGIKSIDHDGSSWAASARAEYNATGGGGSLPFIADIARYGNTLYAADFANSRLLAFGVGADGALSLRGSLSVSQGPVALLVDVE